MEDAATDRGRRKISALVSGGFSVKGCVFPGRRSTPPSSATT